MGLGGDGQTAEDNALYSSQAPSQSRLHNRAMGLPLALALHLTIQTLQAILHPSQKLSWLSSWRGGSQARPAACCSQSQMWGVHSRSF